MILLLLLLFLVFWRPEDADFSFVVMIFFFFFFFLFQDSIFREEKIFEDRKNWFGQVWIIPKEFLFRAMSGWLKRWDNWNIAFRQSVEFRIARHCWMVIEGGGKGATKYFEYFRSRIFSRDVNRISIAETDGPTALALQLRLYIYKTRCLVAGKTWCNSPRYLAKRLNSRQNWNTIVFLRQFPTTIPLPNSS